MKFDYLGEDGALGAGADLTLVVNDKEVATGSLDATVPASFGIDNFRIGEDSGQPVTHEYEAPFPFTGTIGQVVVEIR